MTRGPAGEPTPAVAPPIVHANLDAQERLLERGAHLQLLRRIIGAYDALLVRAYCLVRFRIINLDMLQVLGRCLRGQRRVLEVGCGFGLFGCYFTSRDPGISWHGIDLDRSRIDMASKAAGRLGLTNVTFEPGDARDTLRVGDRYDAVLMMDLLHHLPDDSKRRLLQTALSLLTPGGRLVIKDVTRRPAWKLLFTWVLDVLMTRGFEMWYWSPSQLKAAIGRGYSFEMFPVHDWLPYPHVIYVVSRDPSA